MPTYDFRTQLHQGEAGEAALDAYFAQKYQITHATMSDQRRGIDRFFYNPVTGFACSIDYKTDTRAAQSGNAFIETTHSDRPGWAYTSEADFIFYYLPQSQIVYAVGLKWLREKRLPQWVEAYPIRSADNGGYTTYGLIVPLDVFGRCASKLFDLRKELT